MRRILYSLNGVAIGEVMDPPVSISSFEGTLSVTVVPLLSVSSSLLAFFEPAFAQSLGTDECRSSDVDYLNLNYALTLEHLQTAFYTSAMARFTDRDWATNEVA